MRYARQNKANLTVKPPDGNLLCIEMRIQYFQGFNKMCRCRLGTMVFVKNQTPHQIMATRLHPIIARLVALFVESQGGTYKRIRKVMILDSVIYRFHRVD